MKTFKDIEELNENQVIQLLTAGKISVATLDEYYIKTSIYQRSLTNNSIWNQITK